MLYGFSMGLLNAITKIFNTASNKFSTSDIKKCNGAICYTNLYKKHLKLVRHYHSFLSGFLSTLQHIYLR